MSKMVVDDILKHRIIPFEIEDKKLKQLFSYYLHLAPSVESAHSRAIPPCGMEKAWIKFKDEIKIDENSYHFYASGSSLGVNQLKKYILDGQSEVKKGDKRFSCKYKEGEALQLVCLLRHIRNLIAHGYVYLVNDHRKYIVFDDYNYKKNQTARILFMQSDLEKLKKILNGGK